MVMPHNKKYVEEILSTYIFADFKFLYLYTTEELKTLKILEKVATNTEVENIYTYDIVEGLQCKKGNDNKLKYRKTDELVDIYRTFNYITNNIEAKSIVVLKDIHNLFDSNPFFCRALKNCILDIKMAQLPINLIGISPVINIPQEIEKEAIVLDIPLPSRDEIENLFDKFTESINFMGVNYFLKSKFIEALNGLTEQEIQNILQYCIQDGELDEKDINSIINQKKQLIKKGGILEFIKPEENICDIGGLNELKKWLDRKKMIFDQMEKARKFSVDLPKGFLLFGMPGCGKSLSAKVTANYFDMPLLRLDIGMIMGPYLGQSEENMRKAIKLAEAIAPSVLWIDEIEKAFVGVFNKGNNSNSSDVTSRIFGTILTWMQEKKKPVFVVATANSITGMPPEFLRKGRFDEIFFVDFPNKEETKEIFKVHLKKRSKIDWFVDDDMNTIVAKMSSKLFSGADIEAVVKEIIEEAFINKKERVSKDDALKIIDTLKPLSQTMKSEIEELKKKVREYGFRSAN